MSAIHNKNQQDPYVPDYSSISGRFGSSILPRELGHQALNVSAEQSWHLDYGRACVNRT